MKNLISIFLLTFSFNSYSGYHYDATMEDYCIGALEVLNQNGFNFTYKELDPFYPIMLHNGMYCGTTNTGNMIHIYPQPARIFVFDKFSTSYGYCVQQNGRYEKTTSSKCY